MPSATYHLARAISTWTAVEHITLTNLSFPSDELGRHTPFADQPLLPPLRTLRTLYVGQATLLPPSAVAAMVAALRPGGWLLLEHGWDQADAVAGLLAAAGFGAIAHRHDLGGHARCTGGCWQAMNKG